MKNEDLVKRVLVIGEIEMEPELVREVLEAKLKAKENRETITNLKKENEELKKAFWELADTYNDVLEDNINLREEISNIHKLLEF